MGVVPENFGDASVPIEEEASRTVVGVLEKKIDSGVVWAALKRLSRQDSAENCDALAAMAWCFGTSNTYAGHIRALDAPPPPSN